MKLAMCYTVFDGLELLEKSILNMIPVVDFTIICYQTVSNKGNIKNDIAFDLDKYVHNSDIYLVRYKTDLTLGPKENERRKHNLMLSKAREYGATHLIMSATDHFYDTQEVFQAKRLVEKKDYDVTFTSMFTYFKKPTWQIDPIETYYMPFICKINPLTKVERVKNYPLLVDPSVQLSPFKNWYLFTEKQVMLHHYSVCRTDIREKYLNAASPWTADQVDEFEKDFNEYDLEVNPGVKYFLGRKIKVVPDYFNLNSIFEF